MEIRSQRKHWILLHTFPFSYLWAGRKYTNIPDTMVVAVSGNLQWRQTLSDLQIKKTLKVSCKEVCSKVTLVKSSLKNSYLLWGLHLNPQSSEKGKTSYTGYGTRQKKAQEWSWCEVEWEITLKITQSPTSTWKTSLNFEFSQLCWCHALAVLWY